MKEFSVSNFPLGNISLEEAFHKVFSPDSLRRIHGTDMMITDWNHKLERSFQFFVDLPQIPNEIKRFFCGSRLKITTKQQMTKTENNIQVKNKIKLHVLGAEFVSVRPTFYLHHENKRSFLSINIEHRARFPPPLNKIIEGFMTHTSERAFETFTRLVLQV